MAFSDNFFKKIEKKTSVNKETILSLASKLQQGDMKNEDTLKEVIRDISKMTGKEVSKEKEQKIINAVLNNQVPNNLDKYLDYWEILLLGLWDVMKMLMGLKYKQLLKII